MAPKFYQDEDGWRHPISQRPVSPKELIKLILRPADGLNLAFANPSELHHQLCQTARLSPNEATTFTVRVDPSKNLAFLNCRDKPTAEKIGSISSISTNSATGRVSIYISAAHDTCKGVVHNIQPGTDSDYLLKHLSAPGYTITSARMMGKTGTAIITFMGTYIPRDVIYAGGEYRCRPHRPRAQFCRKCLAIGHRADVCTKTSEALCPKCGKGGQEEDHQDCLTQCINCGGNHSADDKTCEKRQAADSAVRYQAYHKRIIRRRNLNTEQNSQQSKQEEAQQRGRSHTRFAEHETHNGIRSRSKSSSRQRSSSRPGAPSRSQDLIKQQSPENAGQPQVSQPLLKSTHIRTAKQANKSYRDAVRTQTHARREQMLPRPQTLAQQSSLPPNHSPPVTVTTPDIQSDMDTESNVAINRSTPGPKRSRTDDEGTPDGGGMPPSAHSDFDLQIHSQRLQEVEVKVDTLLTTLEERIAAMMDKVFDALLERRLAHLTDILLHRFEQRFDHLLKTAGHLTTLADQPQHG